MCLWSKVWALPLTKVALWSDVNLDSSEPLFLLNYMYTYTTHSHTLTLKLSQETLSNTLGHQFNLSRSFSDKKCDVCRKTISFLEVHLTCTRESLLPPLLSSPFFFLLPSSLFFDPFFSSFLLFPLFPFLLSHPSFLPHRMSVGCAHKV